VKPRYGRRYAATVLRPLAEQVVGALDVQPGETVCDLICDGGTLGVAMGAAVGRHGTVALVDIDEGLLQSAVREVGETGCEVWSHIADRDASPLTEPSCDRIASLCTHGFWDGAALFGVAAHATRPGGCAAIVTWDAALPPLHEVALVDALHDVCGIHSRFLDRCLASVDAVGAAGWEQVALHDVARFDGIGDYWAAMVVARPLAAELADVSDDLLYAVRAACQRALEPCTAADGTMLIPVHATLYRRAAGSGA
jgi:SAM-dependent methyltransferase